MSIKTKIKKIDIDGEEFFLSFTMSSMHKYKEAYKTSALTDLMKLQKDNIDEEILFRLFCVCLKKKNGNKFEMVEDEYFDELNPLAVITEYSEVLLDVCFSSLPTPKPNQKKTKKAMK